MFPFPLNLVGSTTLAPLAGPELLATDSLGYGCTSLHHGAAVGVRLLHLPFGEPSADTGAGRHPYRPRRALAPGRRSRYRARLRPTVGPSLSSLVQIKKIAIRASLTWWFTPSPRGFLV